MAFKKFWWPPFSRVFIFWNRFLAQNWLKMTANFYTKKIAGEGATPLCRCMYTNIHLLYWNIYIPYFKLCLYVYLHTQDSLVSLSLSLLLTRTHKLWETHTHTNLKFVNIIYMLSILVLTKTKFFQFAAFMLCYTQDDASAEGGMYAILEQTR